MKTFAESLGQPKFNWFEFLSKESFTDPELREARLLSESWVTCACGNQCAIIPRDFAGMPKDDLLIRYGTDFSSYIILIATCSNSVARNRYAEKAIRLLELIEKRSSELIN